MNHLKELRESKELNIHQLQELSKVNRSVIKRLEEGQRDFTKVSVSTAYKLAKALGVKIEDLYDFEEL